MIFFFQTTAIYMVVAVSTERYRAVCHPLVRRQVHKVITFVERYYRTQFPSASIISGWELCRILGEGKVFW